MGFEAHITPGGELHSALEELEKDGVLVREGARYRTTRRWQDAMSKAAAARDQDDDLHAPIKRALAALYGDRTDEHALARYVSVLTAIETSNAPPPRRR
jgi:hypothetical protein